MYVMPLTNRRDDEDQIRETIVAVSLITAWRSMNKSVINDG